MIFGGMNGNLASENFFWKWISRGKRKWWNNCSKLSLTRLKNNREVSYFRLSKDSRVHKDWIHATGHPLDNMPSIMENLRKFSNSYSQEQTEHVHCHFFEFLHNIFCKFHLFRIAELRQRYIQSPIKYLRWRFWRK